MCFSAPSIPDAPAPLPPPPPVPAPITDDRKPILATPKQAKKVKEQKTNRGNSRTSSKKKTGKSGLTISLGGGGRNVVGSGLTIPKA